FDANTCETVNEYILNQIITDHPDKFELSFAGDRTVLLNIHTGEIIIWHTSSMEIIGSQYSTLFDALSSQLQEDLAVVQLAENSDWLAAIHLCAPNHWSPGEKIGQPFDHIHRPVPGMEKTMPHYRKMLESAFNKGPFTRFAWGISTDNRLNHHPVPPPGQDPDSWRGRSAAASKRLYVRTEKQNLIGFSAINAFLFTIRTYFYPVDELSNVEKTALWTAVQSMSEEALQYKGMQGVQEKLAELMLHD
ncbi:MAG TPA: DUF3445 domain-containing protein, partial [Flavihumibacter sp.]|nr:DUF3445 domain-containing protein [Flavihumibacter sp.]